MCFRKSGRFRRITAFLAAICLTVSLGNFGISAFSQEQEQEMQAAPEDTSDYMEGVGPASVLSWEWECEEELLSWREDVSLWTLGLPGTNEENRVTADALSELLPSAVSATFADGVRSLPLEWDFSPLPEDGAYEGSITLTASLPEGCALTEGTPSPMVLLELGGGEPYYTGTPGVMKFLNNWSFVENGAKITQAEDSDEGNITILVPDLKKETCITALKKVLPEEIYAYGNMEVSAPDKTNDTLTNAGFRYKWSPTDPHPTLNKYYGGWISIDWADIESSLKDLTILEEASEKTNPDGTPWKGYSFHARAHSSYSGTSIYVNSNQGTSGGDDRDGKFILTLNVRFTSISNYTVSAVEPANTTVNLFDYWVETKEPSAPQGDILTKTDDNHFGATSLNNPRSGPSSWNKGINLGHLLIFGDGVIHAGFWNKGSGQSTDYGKQYAGMEGIIESRLAANGYPSLNLAYAKKQLTGITDPTDPYYRNFRLIGDYKLSRDYVAGETEAYDDGTSDTSLQNLSNTVIDLWKAATGQTIENGTESLDYLFNPDIVNSYKESYTDVKGLFQLDRDGYYYYNMRENFAEYNKDANKFILYNAPATKRTDDATGAGRGNFFPFNSGSEVFDGLDSSNKLTSSIAPSGNSMNHHFGMTVETDFRQPEGGVIHVGAKKQDMTFEFSGDDDVWVFIDDVLVLDLGGTHSELYGTINFADGKVYIGEAFDTNGIPDNPANPHGGKMVTETTIREMFEKAGADNIWKGDTFADNTDHTLKMFYLERGNYDSSLAVRFNLQPRLYQQIKKVDQNGNPIEGVVFGLHPVTGYNLNGKDPAKVTLEDVEGHISKTPVITLTTGKDGTAQLIEPDSSYVSGGNLPFNFTERYNNENIQFYVMKEIKTPAGYRSLPIPVLLRFDLDTTMLITNNRYDTGSYASFTSTISASHDIYYGRYDANTGDISSDLGRPVAVARQENGLAVAIPMQRQSSTGVWEALYGSNLSGFHVSKVEDVNDVAAWREAALLAMLYQCAGNARAPEIVPGWFLTWGSANHLEGFLSDLPGRADQYLLSNPTSGNRRMVYGLIEDKALQALGIPNTASGEERYKALGDYLNDLAKTLKTDSMTEKEALGLAVQQTLKKIMAVRVTNSGSNLGFSFLDVDQFNRSFRSLIYIPNEQRELRVQKVDQNGTTINGAVFSLYRSAADAKANRNPVATGATDTVNGQDGVLIFAPYDSGEKGHAKMEWENSVDTRYYLKEVSAPSGYHINPTVIPVIVGVYSIYADAGTPEDGVTVMAGVGKLAQTMVKFASDNNVDITLRDITAYAQSQPSGQFNSSGWKDMKLQGTNIVRSLNLHYGLNAVVDYGLHDEDGGKYFKPFFVTDSGFIRTRVKQNTAALKNGIYGDAQNQADFDEIDGDITNLFSLLNTVVVTDTTTTDPNTGSLAVSKHIEGPGLNEKDYTRLFSFKIILTDEKGKDLPGEYYFYGTDKAGYVKSGDEILLHHDESITILGLPAGTQYSVTEGKNAGTEDFYSLPISGNISGIIHKDESAFATFFNAKEPYPDGDLILSKTVGGLAGEKDREFTFSITLTDPDGRPLEDAYRYAGSKKGAIRSGETVTLKHNESIVIVGLPIGAKYSVAEIEANQEGYLTQAENTEGEIKADEAAAVSFSNFRDALPPEGSKTGNLVVSKTVTGEGADLQRAFTFRVRLTDAHGKPLTGSYRYDGSHEGMLKSDGVITLRHSEYAVIHGLPEGTHYTVTEENNEGYTVAFSGTEGSISLDGIHLAAFQNTKSNTSHKPGEPNNPNDPNGPNDPNNPNNPPLPSTGESENDAMGWLILAALSFAGLISVIAFLRRQKNAKHIC